MYLHMAQKKRERPRKVNRYRHLTVFERSLIGQKHKEGWHVERIASLVKRDRSTIIRELARNGAPKTKKYRPESAHTKALERRKKRGVRPRLKNKIVRTYTEEKLRLGWSPEQISIRLPIDHTGQRISTEAIYQYIYASSSDLSRTGK